MSGIMCTVNEQKAHQCLLLQLYTLCWFSSDFFLKLKSDYVSTSTCVHQMNQHEL